MQRWLSPSDHGKLFAVDLETLGTDPTDPDCLITCIGFANETGCWSLDLRDLADECVAYVKQWLTRVRLTSFNVMFDGTFLQVWTGQWLDWIGCSYGLRKQLSTEGHTGQTWDLESAQLELLGWLVTNKTERDAALAERGWGKAEMGQLPPEILGPYCAADTDAHWQLWHYLLTQAAPHPTLMDYHTRVFMTEVRLLAAQQIRGMQVGATDLAKCYDNLLAGIQSQMSVFLHHKQVEQHITAHNEQVRETWRKSEPPRFLKSGEESARWQNWLHREHKFVEERGFNPNSKQQLATLFFDKMGFKSTQTTPGGARSVDRKVLPTLGEPGRILTEYNVLVKRRGYVEAVREKSARDGLIHPQFNSVGTVTTRLGGSGGLNMQQMPKVADFLHCLRARPGHVLVDIDAEALEPTILAEFSQDKTLLSLYGANAKPNDIYLYVAAKIPALGREIRKYYDPDNPTPEGIAAAKKHCKRDRQIAKVVQLSSAYGAGPAKIFETLILSGIDISFGEVVQIHKEYWRLFAGVKRFGEQLTDMWNSNGGWIPSMLGTPICVAPMFLKDINNRFCQTSGHLFLQLWIYHTERLRTERGLTVVMHPWLIDNHDEMIFEVEEQHVDTASVVLVDALAATNQEVGMDISIKGRPETGQTLAAFKVEGYDQWLDDQEDEAA